MSQAQWNDKDKADYLAFEAHQYAARKRLDSVAWDHTLDEIWHAIANGSPGQQALGGSWWQEIKGYLDQSHDDATKRRAHNVFEYLRLLAWA